MAGADVARSVAVRDGWSNFPTCNLYNKTDWPVVPFTSDDWLPEED